MSYFVIFQSDDGLQINGPMSRENLLEKINKDKYGSNYYGKFKFLNVSEVMNHDWNRIPDDTLVVICGETIVPIEKKTVVKFEIP